MQREILGEDAPARPASDPLSERLVPITTDHPLEKKERAYLALPAELYRVTRKDNWPPGGPRVMADTLLDIAGQAADDPRPRYVAGGDAIFTDRRVIFADGPLTAAFAWTEFSDLREGADHLRLIRPDGSAEVLHFGATALAADGRRIGLLALRLWHEATPVAPAEPASTPLPDPMSAASLAELRQLFGQHRRLLEADFAAKNLPPDFTEPVLEGWQALASFRFYQISAAEDCDDRELRETWAFLGNKEPFDPALQDDRHHLLVLAALYARNLAISDRASLSFLIDLVRRSLSQSKRGFEPSAAFIVIAANYAAAERILAGRFGRDAFGALRFSLDAFFETVRPPLRDQYRKARKRFAAMLADAATRDDVILMRDTVTASTFGPPVQSSTKIGKN